MNEDLENEIEALNSIYGENTLTPSEAANIFVLSLPQNDTSLRIEFPEDYPNAPPAVLGVNSSGEHAKRGEANHILDVFRNGVGRLFEPGVVCLYDVIEDLVAQTEGSAEAREEVEEPKQGAGENNATTTSSPQQAPEEGEEPPWTLSDVVIEKGSIFIARAAPVTSPAQAKAYLNHLLSTDKKVARATHNMTAHRIRGPPGTTISYQDCDDDGESAAGGRLLHLMQLMDLWDCCVVITRWYGGHHLGPARFGIINGCARDAFVKAGFVEGEGQHAGGVKKKGKK